MQKALAECELFQGLSPEQVARLAAVAQREALTDGERLFSLGQAADRLFVVLQGGVDISMPLSVRGAMREVTLESKGTGSALGWSAFVGPHRFRLSALATGDTEVAAFERSDLEALFESDPDLGYRFTLRVAEVIAQRLLTAHALWARELQQRVATVE